MQSHLDQCRYNMVEQQVRPWDVLDDKVLTTLETIPRDQYVPAQYINLAYADTAIPLNDSQNMMHPIIEGRILQLLNIQPEDNILEIGTGSGYLTACLANMASHVDSVEIDETLAKKAAQTLLEQGVFNISLSCANGLDLPEMDKKYNAIVLTGSVSEIPRSFKNALTINGKMFVIDGVSPVMTAHIITRTGDNEWSDESVFETDLKPLVHGEQKPEFEL
ncbi:MAG: protein-L-isoaspartate O-methyltransferase [Gammaproteobacteria bacterium]|nr:protein-L-isoaspartate O-methyltransferase [Gammaproteobacteria bacterium]